MEWVDILRGHVAGTFGDIGAGDVWDQFGELLNELHNNASTLFKSATFVDDMGAFSPPYLSDIRDYDGVVYKWHHLQDWLKTTVIRHAEGEPSLPQFDLDSRYAILDAVLEARDNLACIFGENASEDRKAKIFVGFVELVGWHFDLRYPNFSVRPLEGKLDKIAHYLFNLIPDQATTVDVHLMESLTGLLCWFSVALPLGKSFVYSLFQCKRIGNSHVLLHATALRDLTFWRALIRIALDSPELFGCPLDNLRSDRVPDIRLCSDACTGMGGGSFWARVHPAGDIAIDRGLEYLVTRWTPDEQAAIAARLSLRPPTTDEWLLLEAPVRSFAVASTAPFKYPSSPLTINVLEFAQVVFSIMVYAPILRDKTIDIGVDNIAAMCWLVRNRASSGAADTLLKLLAITCVLFNIRIVAHHIRGVDNWIPDWLSRVLGIDHLDHHNWLSDVPTLSHIQLFDRLQDIADSLSPYKRLTTCRLILSYALVGDMNPPVVLLIRLIFFIHQHDHGSEPVSPTGTYTRADDRVSTVFSQFDRAYRLDQHPNTIPMTIDDAFAAAPSWCDADSDVFDL
jgi:hypothetical protein